MRDRPQEAASSARAPPVCRGRSRAPPEENHGWAPAMGCGRSSLGSDSPKKKKKSEVDSECDSDGDSTSSGGGGSGSSRKQQQLSNKLVALGGGGSLAGPGENLRKPARFLYDAR